MLGRVRANDSGGSRTQLAYAAGALSRDRVVTGSRAAFIFDGETVPRRLKHFEDSIIEHVRGMHDLAERYASDGGMTAGAAQRTGRILGKRHTLDVNELPEERALQPKPTVLLIAPNWLRAHRSLRS